MKTDFDKKFVKGCLYAGITVIVVFALTTAIGFVPAALQKTITFLKKIVDILMPVVIGLAFAYLLYGPVTAIENFLLRRKHFFIKKRGGCRALGIIITYICFIGIIIAMVLGMYFMIGGQISNSTTINNIWKTLSSYFENNTISADALQQQLAKYDLPFMDLISSKMGEIASLLSDFLSWLVSFLFGSAVSIGSNLFTWGIGFILSIYFLQSSHYYKKLWRKTYYLVFRNSKAGKVIRHCLYVINYTFSNYIRGQLIEAFLVGVLSTLVLYILRIDYALVIGIISGICNLIPYIGPLIGTVLAGLVALLGGDIWLCIWAVIGMQIVQQIDGNIMAPRVVGNIVGLPSAFIIIAILIGGDYGGLLGMLIAVPICASAKVLIGEWFEAKHGAAFEISEEIHEQEVFEFEETHKRQKEKRERPSFRKSLDKFFKKG